MRSRLHQPRLPAVEPPSLSQLSRHRLRQCALGLGCLLLGSGSWAQTPAGGAPAASETASAGPAAPVKFAIRGFQVKGDNPLTASETTEVLAKFLRQDADIEVLQQATNALETRLRERGYALHRVALPPQEIGETVSLEIVKFTISKVLIERDVPVAAPAQPPAATPAEPPKRWFDDANIARSLPELQAGTTPNFRRLARQTAMANDAATKQISVGLKESDQPDQIDATVRVREVRPWWVSVSAANNGSPSSGNDRISISGAHANLFNRDHQASISLTTSGEKTKDVQQYGLSYRVPFYAFGGVLGGSATKSNVVGNFGTFSSTGAGATWGINYTHHLPAEGGHRGYINVSFDNKRFDVAEINGIPFPGQRMRRSQPLAVGYSARNESDARNIAYSLDLASNLAGSSGNDLLSYQTEDPRIQTAKFHVLRGSFNYLTPLWERKWLWNVRAQLQYSAHALISGEQFGLGGLSSVRGTSDRPISGDKGMSISSELTSPELFTGLRVHGFIDAGYLTNVVSNNATKLDADRLASAGVGLRFNHVSGFSLAADYGRIVTGSKVLPSISNSSPQRGDEKIHLNASFRF